RRLSPDRRPGAPQGPGHHRVAAPPGARGRDGADVSEYPDLRRSDGLAEPLGGPESEELAGRGPRLHEEDRGDARVLPPPGQEGRAGPEPGLRRAAAAGAGPRA